MVEPQETLPIPHVPPPPAPDDPAPPRGWWERTVLEPLFRRVIVEGDQAALRTLAADTTLIYVTSARGRMETRYFHYLLRSSGLPPALLCRGPLAGPVWRRDPPVRPQEMVERVVSGQSLLIPLRTSPLFDDVLWEDPTADPLRAVVLAARRAARPLAFVPLQFYWDRQPEKATPSVTDLLFGDPTHPGGLRKGLLFGYYYARRPIVQLGEPIRAAEVLPNRESAMDDDVTTARTLRRQLLTRFRRQRKVLAGPPLKPRRWMIDQVLAADGLQRTIYETAAQQGQSIDDCRGLTRRYLHEIAADINYRVVELAARFLGWVFNHIYDGVVVTNPDALTTLRHALEQGPAVLVPNHRSHIDYLLLSTLLYQHNIALPYVAGGNNLAFWPLGPFGRRCGAFFLRRSFGGNPLYRATFAEYLALLVREGHCIEFFIEGGRSRTGKTLPPRMGILTMLTDALQAQAARDLTFIPISLSYDQAIEQSAYASELHGRPKKRESRWDLLKLWRHLRGRYGRIYVQIGEPIPFWATARETAPQAEPQAVAMPAEVKRQMVRHTAVAITRAINRGLLATPTALAATTLLLEPGRALPEADFLATAPQLLDYLRWRETPCAPLLTGDPRPALRDALEQLRGLGRITRHDAFAPVCYTIDEGKRILLDYNKNTIIHAFVSLACLCVILRAKQRAGRTQVALTELADDFRTLQSLFRHEFTFATRRPLPEHLQWLVGYLAERGHIRTEGEPTTQVWLAADSGQRLRLFAMVLRNYFEAYKAVLLGLQQRSDGRPESEWTKYLLGYAQHLLRLGEIRCPEAVSQSIFQNALRAFREMGLLHTTKEGLTVAADATRLGDLVRQLEEWC